MAAAERWTPRQDNPYAGLGDEDLDDVSLGMSDGSEGAGIDADATRLVTPVAADDATRVVPAKAAETVRVADPDATRLSPVPATERLVADPDATRQVAAPAPDPTVFSDAAALERALEGRPRTRPVNRSAARPVTRRAGAPVADLHRAQAARDLLDRQGAVWDEDDPGRPVSRGSGRRARARSKGPLGRRRLRFWRWFRTVPILLMVAMGLMAAGLSLLPGTAVRHWLFPVHYAQAVQDSAERHGVDPALVAAVIKSESNWVSTARSGAGAEGLMQLMPSTAKELASRGIVDSSVYDPSELSDPAVNIEYGTAYLASLLNSTGSQDRAVAAYNAGPGAASSWDDGGSNFKDAIEYPETRLYLEKVTEAYEQYQKLYPDGLTDDAAVR
ncbi:transglycosylase SLT domain-containing protein [Atopobiaceae bacterium 24-176]